MAGHEIVCGGFRVGRQIGVGGQALVCEAECVEDRYGLVPAGTLVALKVAKIPLPHDRPTYEDEQTWDRRRRRVDELKRLDHPNVVKYFGCFSEIADLGGMDGICRVHVIVMELLKGVNLKDALSRSEQGGKPTGLDADDALSVIRGAVSALAYVSRFGIVHRDIKPANIFVCEDGTVKIIDFELAAQENVTQSTNAGGLKGTLNYMAPEFTEEDFRGDETSDVFSMGVVMHQLLTGSLPYDALSGNDGGETLVSYFSRWMAVKNGGPSPVLVWPIVSRLLRGISPVMEKALSPVREARFATFAELEKALEKVAYCEVENGRRRYRYLRMIGKGGFGEVFKARDLSTGALVAVKRLFNMSFAARFEREAKTLKLLQDQDRCFVKFVDFFVRPGSGVHENEAFLVMEYLEGMPGNSLREAINAAAQTQTGVLDKLAVLLVFERYARGLAVMHRNGIIHRDIKPSNLYYADGRPESAVIMDFGIVRDLNAEQTTGNVPCTLDYAPPEIILDENERGQAGMDIYALGHCLYEALTGKLCYGRLPSGLPGYTQFIQRVHNQVRPKFSDPLVRQDRKLLKLIEAMTELDPAKRLSSADDVAQALRGIIAGIEHLNDVTVPLDREAARKMWEKYHPKLDDPPPPPIPRPVPVDRTKSRRWIWLSVLGLASVCAAYFGPTHGPQLLKMLQSSLRGGAVPVMQDDNAEVPVSEPNPVPTNPPPIPVVVVTNRLVVTNVVSQPHPDPVVITNKIEKPVVPPPPAPPPEVKVRVTVPQLASDVKCYFKDELRKSGAVFAVRPGEYGVVYRRFGYKAQEVAFVARKDETEMFLPTPADWVAEPVPVSLPMLDEGVTCRVDGKKFSSGQGVLPGRHSYMYERANYLSQGGEFDVKPGVERSVPAPREWRPAPVEVRVPVLEEGVKCEVDGRSASSGSVLKMAPGSYRYAYSRRAYRTQRCEFTVVLGEACNVPPPVEWEHDQILVKVPKLDDGIWCEIDGKVIRDGVSRLPGKFSWVYAREGCVSKTNEHQLAVADFPRYVLPEPDGKWISANKPVPPPQSLKDAMFYYDNEEFYDTVRCFAEAAKSGYRLTDVELRMVKHAYNTMFKKLGQLIENIEHDMSQGRTPIRPLKEVQDERKNLLSWRRMIDPEK